MSRRSDTDRLWHMLTHAREAVAFSVGRKREELENDRLLELALVRLVEVIGEAAARVSSECQMRLPQIPWPQVVGMRNRLIHGYDVVDFDVLWDTVANDLPPLIATLESILGPNETEAN